METEYPDGVDRDGVPMPDYWALYWNGQLVFSCDNWEAIGPGVEKIMKEA